MAEETPAGGPLPSLAEARGWAGYEVDEIGGSSVGRVHGLLIDSERGDPAWLLVKLGRFGKAVPIPFADCVAAGGRVWAPYEREAIRSAPAVDPERALTREHELAICAHYGIHPQLGRAAEAAARPEGAITSQPPP